ncbi:MAG TPA: hypothetical protein VHE55_19765 [Fimbriimonadaceae bacterium]|nr:hypothetical protein [Fimbriimonadaceae bacterium]
MRWLLVAVACLASFARGQVPQGTTVHLMLLKEISSTSSHIGEVVPMVVTEDVVVRGKVMIPEGTMAFAKVSQCRREGALSAPVFDKPARLWLSLEHLRDVDGHEVKLSARPNRLTDLQLTRDIKVKASAAQTKEFEEALENPTSRPVMQKVRNLFSDTAVSLSEGEAEVLIQHNVEMPVVKEAIRTGVFGEVVDFIRDIKHAHMVEVFMSLNPATRPALTAIRAVRELGRLSGGLGDYIEGRFKGRNIRCAVGVELIVYAG